MEPLSDGEKRRIMEASPKGTLALMLVFGVIFLLAWLLMYFGRFVQHGPVS